MTGFRRERRVRIARGLQAMAKKTSNSSAATGTPQRKLAVENAVARISWRWTAP
jgi:hypothetical protein